MSVLQRVDPNEPYRNRRKKQRRKVIVQRAVAVAFLLGTVTGLALGLRVLGRDAAPPEQVSKAKPVAQKALKQPRALPQEIRGVHVTMALASLPGKLEEYLAVEGLNTVELDVKDENGEVAFKSRYAPLAAKVAARDYYDPAAAVAKARKAGVYLIGRVVCFEDPVLSQARPDMAILRPDGSRWTTSGGLGWVNPYNTKVWDYLVDVAESAARAGFDEIQFDYVRFPSDGDVSQIVFPGQTTTPKGFQIAKFLQYASKRLKPLGVRVSADVFGLSATRDLGIGQVPRRIANYLDAIYPMVYPSHYGSGEYNLDDPNAVPGETVRNSMIDFNRQLRGRKTYLVPWLQDFSLGRTYTLDDVRAQIDAARVTGARGFMLWNASGLYTDGALAQ